MNANPAAGAFTANLRSIFFMVIACACFVANDINTKLAVEYLPTPEIITIRAVTAFILSLVLVIFVHGLSQIKTIANRQLFWRSLFEGSVGPMIITCYAFLPIATVTAVMQIGPFLGMIAGIYLFREAVGWRRWCAALVAFFGVLLIVKPGGEAFQPVAFVVVLIAAMGVGRDVQSRRIGKAVPTFVVPLATSVLSMTLALVLTPIVQQFGIRSWGPWRWPEAYPLALCIMSGCCLVMANAFAFMAFRSGDMSVVSPFRYFYLFFAVLGGIVIFAEIPDWLSLSGMALIVAAGLYLLQRERLRAKHAVAASTGPTSG